MINTRLCTGITFFIYSGATYAVHAHTPRTPFAEATFERLLPGSQRAVAWVYVPLARGDAVESFEAWMTDGGHRKFLYLVCEPQFAQKDIEI